MDSSSTCQVAFIVTVVTCTVSCSFKLVGQAHLHHVLYVIMYLTCGFLAGIATTSSLQWSALIYGYTIGYDVSKIVVFKKVSYLIIQRYGFQNLRFMQLAASLST